MSITSREVGLAAKGGGSRPSTATASDVPQPGQVNLTAFFASLTAILFLCALTVFGMGYALSLVGR